MASKRKKAHYECKQKVVCLSCGDVILSEQKQKHTKAKHKGEYTRFKFQIDESKQPKLQFGSTDKNRNVASDADPPEQHEELAVQSVQQEEAVAGKGPDQGGGDRAMAAASVKEKSDEDDDDPFFMWHLTASTSKAADPRWVEERDKQISQKQEEAAYASGQSIESSLKQDGAQEMMIGKKIGEEVARPAERPGVWDGHSNTADSAARAARANVSVEDQIAQIHRQKVSKKDLFTFAPRIHFFWCGLLTFIH